MGLLWLFVDTVQLNYLLGAVVAIEITIVLTYVLNNAWTFRHVRNTGLGGFLTGLLKTNIVRGSAIPIQLAVLFVLVEYGQVLYLLSNAIAILLSGIYRFILDARWTWGLT
jgi:putative flippase GtrA